MWRTLTLLTLYAIYASVCGSSEVNGSAEESSATSQRGITLINLINSTLIIGQSAHNATTSNSGLVLSNNHRIVGGRKIAINEAPYQVAIIQEGTFICGGSIISRSWVLTAAHCVHGYTNQRHAVRAGSTSFRSGGQLRTINRINYHNNYNTRTNANDIALLHTSRPFTFNSNVQPVKLPTSSDKPKSYFTSGWGTLSENSAQPSKHLRGVNVFPVKRTSCAVAYRDVAEVTSKQLCAQAPQKDSCQGDSGGALTSKNIQYGVVSYGVGCARAKYPGVYTNVYKYRSWIAAVTESLN